MKTPTKNGLNGGPETNTASGRKVRAIRIARQIAPGTQMSMAIPYSSALVGSVLMFYYVVKNWWDDFRGTAAESSPSPEPGTEA